ncbi:MAG TPA: hypothetical protein VGB18_04595 [Candidatus Thermoplasmatota archaeon]
MSLRTRTTLLATALLGLGGLFLSASSSVDAQVASACAFEPTGSLKDRRVVDFDLAPTSFRFTSRSEDTTNTMRGSFDLGTARFHVQAETIDATTPIRLTLEYASVVEFRDMDGDGRLGLGDDVVRELALPGAAGATLHSVPRMHAGSYETVARYPLNASALLSGVAELRFIVLSEPATFAGEPHWPSRVFVEASVDNFPSARNDTRLAVKVRQTGGANLTAASDEIVSEGPGGRLSYRWSRCVGRDGAMLPVGPVVVEYPSGATPRTATVFALPYGDRIEHASSIGLSPGAVGPERFDMTSLLPSGNGLVFGTSAVAASALVLVSAWRRIRGG